MRKTMKDYKKYIFDLDYTLLIPDWSKEDDYFRRTIPLEEQEESSPLTLNPFTLSVKDVNFGSPYANLSLDALTINPDGNFALVSELISRDNTLPLRANARINFEDVEIISSLLFMRWISRARC